MGGRVHAVLLAPSTFLCASEHSTPSRLSSSSLSHLLFATSSPATTTSAASSGGYAAAADATATANGHRHVRLTLPSTFGRCYRRRRRYRPRHHHLGRFFWGVRLHFWYLRQVTPKPLPLPSHQMIILPRPTASVVLWGPINRRRITLFLKFYLYFGQISSLVLWGVLFCSVFHLTQQYLGNLGDTLSATGCTVGISWRGFIPFGQGLVGGE